MDSKLRDVVRVTVYALSSSESRDWVRYIGQTTQTLSKRLSAYKSTRANTAVAKWIRCEVAKGRRIAIQAIEEYALPKIAEDRWIALLEHPEHGF